jgi:hypothetical protein
MTDAAAGWLAALSPEQRKASSFAFDDERERSDWAYFPRAHKGLPLHAMDQRPQKLAHVLVSSALSVPAYAQVCAIMALESVLNLLEGRRGDAVRDPGRYFISIFGAPGDARWGWRLEGHHVCLNFTFVDGEPVSATPVFLGANPAAVTHGAHAVSRPCAAEEDAARELLALLDDGQRETAILAGVAPPDFVLANVPGVPAAAVGGESPPPLPQMRQAWEAFRPHTHAVRFSLETPLGLPASRMSAPQRALLDELVRIYVGRLAEPLATLERERVTGDVHFAWAGTTERREGHYYRLQAPGFLVEYDNTQDGANHVHAVWRSPARDFAFDVLRAHTATDH